MAGCAGYESKYFVESDSHYWIKVSDLKEGQKITVKADYGMITYRQIIGMDGKVSELFASYPCYFTISEP